MQSALLNGVPTTAQGPIADNPAVASRQQRSSVAGLSKRIIAIIGSVRGYRRVLHDEDLVVGRVQLSADSVHVPLASLHSSSAADNGDPQFVLQSA